MTVSATRVQPTQPAGDARPGRRARFHRLAVAGIEPLTADAAAITFAVPAGLAGEYAFRAGQHVTVDCPLDAQRRNYSLCGAAPRAGEPPRLRIGVKRVPGGVFSGYALTELAVGDTLGVMTPHGGFTAPRRPAGSVAPRRHVAVAAGSGITPVLSIVATLLRDEPADTVTVLYGNRTAADVMFIDELADLKDRYPGRLELIHTFSREDHDVPLRRGRADAAKVAALLAGGLDAAEVDHWYLCGPRPMIESVGELLAGSGVPAGCVHFELFHTSDVPPPAPVAEPAAGTVAGTVTFTLDGRTGTAASHTEPGGAREPVLTSVLRARPDAPFACRGGVCGTCRAHLLDGAVVMDRNFALEDDEVAAGYRLTCQSRPGTASVTVDYDR